MLPETTERVAVHTPSKVNERIRRKTERNVSLYAASPGLIEERLKELDQEWDIERTLETNGSALLLFGLAMGVCVNRKWLLLPTLVGSFCLQHALQGWCPPIEAFRRLGVRTAREIEEERTGLRTIRGDFNRTPQADT